MEVQSSSCPRSVLPYRIHTQLFYGMGAVKLLLAVLMFTVFYPGCPEGCSCTQTYFVYPIVVLLIGGLWIRDGYRLQEAADEDGGGTSQDMPKSGNDDRGEHA